MNNETMMLLESHFDVAFAAPDGIKKLRELILTLAMQGKLVPQDPNDEPASELLKAIEMEKQKLVEEGKIKQAKPLLDNNPNVIPYEVPNSWEWSSLQDLLALVTDGDHLAPPKAESGIPFLVIGNLNKGKVKIENCRFVPHSYYQLLDWGKKPAENDILYTVTGSYGIPIFIDDDLQFCVQRHVAIFKSAKSSPVEYLMHVLKSMYAFNYATLIATGIAQKTVPLTGLRRMPIAVPPVNEQRRIVAEIDRLMARCDELEKLRADRSQKLLTVHTAALDNLLKAKESSNFSSAWHFITQNFSELYSVKENVAELRKAILQLAVMGKLVPQDPNDEPASELLKAIELEKQRLVSQGDIKKQKLLPKIELKELPYDLPNTWTWVRLGSLAKAIDYGTSMKADDDSAKVPVYRMGNIVNGQLVNRGFKYVDRDIDDLPKLFLRKDDILFNRTNSYELVGKTAIYPGEDNKATFASYLIRVRLVENFSLPTYFSLAMNSPYFRTTQIEPEIVQQCGQANFNGSKLSSTIIPFPPLAEQHRIVAEIDRLMGMCDRLEESIEAAKGKQTDLLNALMSQV